jgi:hypothetical protein
MNQTNQTKKAAFCIASVGIALLCTTALNVAHARSANKQAATASAQATKPRIAPAPQGVVPTKRVSRVRLSNGEIERRRSPIF